jgi:hypothetical protein
MSCRETHGNSAATSLAKFLTGAEEKVVAQTFHELRREAAEALGPSAAADASRAEVLEFLAAAGTLARHDDRVKESRRASLLARIEAATTDAENGTLPNAAVFSAWTQLRDRLDATTSLPDNVGITADGLVITADEVDSARRAAAEAVQNERTLGYRSPSRATIAAQNRARLLQAAYDGTDVGYAALQADEASLADHRQHAAWQARVAAADKMRATPSAIVAVKIEAAQTTVTASREATAQAIAEAKSLEAQWRETRTVALNMAHDRAMKEARRYRRVMNYAIASAPAVSQALSADLASSSVWSALQGSSDASRVECWQAVEVVSADRDGAEVRIGRISESRAVSRAARRAQARQVAARSTRSPPVMPARLVSPRSCLVVVGVSDDPTPATFC